MKEVKFIGSSLYDLRNFPSDVRYKLGVELMAVQYGNMPRNYKPMQTVGFGVYEIRIKSNDGAFRIIYTAKFNDTVYVLHAFNKKTQKTNTQDINLAKQRYKLILQLKK